MIFSATHRTSTLRLTSVLFFKLKGTSIDWDMMVKLRDFRAAVVDNQEMLNTTRGSELGAGNKVSSGKKDAGKAVAEGASELVEANALRIPSMSPVGAPQIHSEDDTKNFPRSSPMSLFDWISVSFPSAFRQSSGKVFDERYPFVTIDPSFIEQIGDEELFLALDSLSFSLLQREFLVRDAASGNILGENQSEDTTLSLSAYLLSRMESSVLESHTASGQKGLSELSEHSKPSSESTIYASAHSTEASSYEDHTLEESQPPRTVSLVRDLISRSQSIDGSTLNCEALKEFLVDVFPSAAVESVRLPALFFTPLQWLAAVKESHDFVLMDAAVDKALRRIAELNLANASLTVETNQLSDCGDVLTEQETKETPQKKKKRKQRKRNKVR